MKLLAASWFVLVVVVSGGAGFVLCVGADGHLSFEWAHVGDCQADADAHHASAAGDVAVVSGCAGEGDACVDVPLFGGDASSHLTKSVQPSRLLKDTPFRPLLDTGYAAVLRAGAFAVDRGPLRRGPQPLRVSAPGVQVQRSVVLRI